MNSLTANIKELIPAYKKHTLILLCIAVLAFLIARGGLVVAFSFIVLPFILLFVYSVFHNPRFGLLFTAGVAIVINGFGRYIALPFGLAIDCILLLTLWAAIISIPKSDWKNLSNGLMLAIFIWFLFTFLELFNPEATSFEAWFYAVRSISLYMVFFVGLAFVLFKRKEDFDILILIWFIGAIVSGLYGLKQLYFGLDDSEKLWLTLYASDTHLIFGKLRVFSFHSDAGQFGAFEAFTAVVSIILIFKAQTKLRRFFYFITGVISVIGMVISGTRGALFVFSGFLFYLILSRNFKVLALGLFSIICIFFLLKYTFIGQGVYQIQRMRSALNLDDPSFQVRLENQRKFSNYLSVRPFGGGIGSAGFWGNRFSPGTFLAETPTDSHYVRVWAETGIVGLLIHLAVLIYIMVRAFVIVYFIKDIFLKQKMMALYAGCFGIIVASYGNQLIGQMPVNAFFCISLAFLFMGSTWDNKELIIEK